MPEVAREHPDRQDESAAPADPAGAAVCEHASGDDAVQVGMLDDRQTPGMEHAEEAGSRRRGGGGRQRSCAASRCRCGRAGRRRRPGSGRRPRRPFGGTVTTTWKYSVGSRIRAASFEPTRRGPATDRLDCRGCGRSCTRRCDYRSGRTARRRSAEGVGAALLDGRHHAALRIREGGPDLRSEGVAVAAEDIRLGERVAWHGRRSVDGLGAFAVGP